MNPRSNILKQLSWLPALWLFTTVTVQAQPSIPRQEYIRQILDQNRQKSQNTNALAVEILTLREQVRQLEARLKRVENTLNQDTGKATAPSPLPATPADQPKPIASVQGAAKLSVCSQGCDFSNLQKAVDAAGSGATITVAAEINGTCAVIKKPLHLIGKQEKDGRRAHLVGGVCNGKAPLVTAGDDITIEGFEISDIAVSDGNGACIRADGSTRNLTIKDIYCHDSQEGVLGSSADHFVIEDSRFVNVGFGNGQAHGLYIWGDDVQVLRCQILSTQNAGHSIKSGARKLLVEDSVIAALNSHNSRAIDLYGGGNVVIRHNVIQQGAQSDNSDVIGLALEAGRLLPDNHALTIENNWIIFDDPGRGILLRGRKLGPITVSNNRMVGLKNMGELQIDDIDNKNFDSRQQAGLPEFDGTLSSLPTTIDKK